MDTGTGCLTLFWPPVAQAPDGSSQAALRGLGLMGDAGKGRYFGCQPTGRHVWKHIFCHQEDKILL